MNSRSKELQSKSCLSSSCNNSAFSLVEIIVAISILATLAIIAYVSAQGIQTSRYNSKRVADIETLGNALETQMMQTQTLPEPTANREYFGSDGTYFHSMSGAFGVTSQFSPDILWKYALADHPRDPDTGGFYSYGRSYETKPQYSVAAVLNTDGVPTALVKGSYAGGKFPSLIKGYNSTNFVKDGGTDVLPYNPTAKVVTAMIVSSTGALVNGGTKPLSAALVTSDTLTVVSGGLAVLKVSDGTELTVGSFSNPTTLVMSDLSLKDDSGLFTKVRLLLSSGEVTARAPKLRDFDSNRSDLEIESAGAVAAVRGTIFHVNAGAGGGMSSSVILMVGKLEMKSSGGNPIVIGGSPNGEVNVPEGTAPVSVQIFSSSGGGIPNVTPVTVSPSQLELIDQTLEGADTSFEYRQFVPESLKLEGTGSTANWVGTGTITIKNGEAKTIKVSSKDIQLRAGSTFVEGDLISWTGAFSDGTAAGNPANLCTSVPNRDGFQKCVFPIGFVRSDDTFYKIQLCRPGAFWEQCAEPYALNTGRAFNKTIMVGSLGSDKVVSCGEEIFDSDGNSYGTVKVGNQCWMSSNMRVGKIITSLTNPLPTSLSGSKLKFCYDDKEENCNATYWALYTWAMAMGVDPLVYSGTLLPIDSEKPYQGICPTGWHVPSDDDLRTLVESQDQVGCESDNTTGVSGYNCHSAGTQLAGGEWKMSTGWVGLKYATSSVINANFNNAGFGLPASGFRGLLGNYDSRLLTDTLNKTTLWTTNNTETWAVVRTIIYTNKGIKRLISSKSYWSPLRCLKN